MKKFNLLSLPVRQTGLLIILTCLLAFPLNTFAGYRGNGNNSNKPKLSKTTLNPAQSLIDINNITTWVSQEGFHDWVVASSWNGAFPNGVSAGAIFSEGIVWGGQVHDGNSPTVRVNGNTYGTGCSPITRLYRVRPDYETGDLTRDAADFLNKDIGQVTSGDIQTLRDQYATDWNEWPADEGAPYEDVNNDGQYEPNVDIPGIPGASQTIFIKYNDNLSPNLYGSLPIGLEVTETYWAYSYTGALGNVIYKKVDMVYKGTPTSASNSRIDSMFIVQWADPDVGQYSDDYAGCDTALNLGYAYSSDPVDAVYQGLGLAPPAVGYDFLQGVSKYTGNPNDSAIFNLKWRKGYKYVNLKPDGSPVPMSSFEYFAAGGTWSDPDFTYTGSLQFYNLMRGKLPRPPYPSADLFPTSVADVTPYGTYLLDGDPVAGTGKIDGVVDQPGDRRIMVTNGPITLNLGDTAEVVVALVGGLGGPIGNSNTHSVSVLKENDVTAQKVYDLLFQLPALKPPDVQIAALSKRINLNWGYNLNNTNLIENFQSQGYNFEGYEVYQLPSPSAGLDQGEKLATYDLIDSVTAVYDTVKDANGNDIPVLAADGKNTGISHYITVDTDPFRHTALRNGQEYYFAVVAYAYNPHPLLPIHILRSPVIVRTVVPQTPTPGQRYTGQPGDTLTVAHTDGASDGIVTPILINPLVTTGNTYTVTFSNPSDTTNSPNALATRWTLTDKTTSTAVYTDSNFTGIGAYPVVNGVNVFVQGPPEGIKELDITGTRWVSGTDFGGSQFFGGMDIGKNFFGSDVTGADYFTVELKWTSGPNSPSDANGWQQGAEYRRDLGYTYGGIGWMPFTAWDVSDPSNPRQINVSFVEDSANGSANLQWDMGWDGSSFAADGGREYLFIHTTSYDPSYYGDYNAGAPDGTYNDVLYAIWPSARGDHPYLEADFTMTIVPNFPILVKDAYSYSTVAPTNSSSLAKTDVNSINVFPNPYYGYQYRETSRDQHYVTFSHLPANAVIRIFDLSGVLVRTITHIPSSGQFERWNLQNDNGYPVASGVYIAYIDMPSLGATKILKLAIVQEQQILRVY